MRSIRSIPVSLTPMTSISKRASTPPNSANAIRTCQALVNRERTCGIIGSAVGANTVPGTGAVGAHVRGRAAGIRRGVRVGARAL